MVTKKPKGLGRGLEALLGPKVDDTRAEVAAMSEAREGQSTGSLKLDELVAGMYQPRTRMDEGALYELAESIKAQGIMQPILVRKLSDGPNAVPLHHMKALLETLLALDRVTKQNGYLETHFN